MHNRSEDSALDFGQSYRKAADYCAIQDRCISEIRSKLKYWNTDSSFIDDVIEIAVSSLAFSLFRFEVDRDFS